MKTKINNAFASALAQAASLTHTHTDELYAGLTGVLAGQGLVCIPAVLGATHIVNSSSGNGDIIGLTTVDAQFELVADDNSSIIVRATGVHRSQDLQMTNGHLIQARMAALLSVFCLSTETLSMPAPAPVPAIDAAKAHVAKTMQQAGLATAVTTADKLEPSKPVIPAVRPASSNLPVTPTLHSALSPDAKNVAEWMVAINDLNPDDMDAWNHHRDAMKVMPGLTHDERKDLFNKLRKEARSLGIEYDSNQLLFFIPQAAETLL